MKVIAQINDNKFMVEATKTELANTMGFYYTTENNCPKIQVGAEIPVSDMYEAVHQLRDNKRAVEKLVEEIKETALKVKAVVNLKPFVEVDKTKN